MQIYNTIYWHFNVIYLSIITRISWGLFSVKYNNSLFPSQSLDVVELRKTAFIIYKNQCSESPSQNLSHQTEDGRVTSELNENKEGFI